MIIVISIHLNLSSLFVVTSRELRCALNEAQILGFGTQIKCPFPLNRGVPSVEVTDLKIM